MEIQERKSLPLAKASTGNLKMPDGSAIEKLFSVSTTLEAAEYFREQLAAQAKSSGLSEQFKDVMTEVDKFVGVMRSQTSTDSNYWSGKAKDAAVSLYKVFHQNISKEAIAALEKKFSGMAIHFDFAMNKLSELLQGFSTSDGKALGETETAKMNDVYSNWLVEHGMACDDGVIFETSKDGMIKKDSSGERVRVNPQEYVNQILDKKNGFAAAVNEKTNGNVNIIVNDVSDTVYPEVEPSQQAGG